MLNCLCKKIDRHG